VSDDERERQYWRSKPRGRPSRWPKPGPGQESVWEYPRPPSLSRDVREVRVEWQGRVLAETAGAWRVCETSSPPTFYLPPEDVKLEWLRPNDQTSLCEWKGRARYFDLVVPDASDRVVSVAWSYPSPDPDYAALRDHLAFFAGRVDACHVGGVRVKPQPGGFYGGWITPEVLGPFKGEPGTEGW